MIVRRFASSGILRCGYMSPENDFKIVAGAPCYHPADAFAIFANPAGSPTSEQSDSLPECSLIDFWATNNYNVPATRR